MVILSIENITQERPDWCWLAIAEQLILWREGSALEQPKLKRLIGKGGGGTLDDIAFLLKQKTDLLTQKMTGGDLPTIEQSIKNREPVILQVSVSTHEHHVILLKGFCIDEKNGERIFLVNDPVRQTGIGIAIKPEVLQNKLKASMLVMVP